jgi:hypothetical protein
LRRSRAAASILGISAGSSAPLSTPSSSWTLIADRFDVTLDELKRKSRSQARKALAHLAVDDAGLTLRGIADWMGVTEWAASKMRQTARDLYTTDAGFRDRVDQIRAALS